MEEEKQASLSEAVFYWQIPEYEVYPKTTKWYAVSLAILTISVILLVIYQNVLFAIFLILYYLIVILEQHRAPQIVEFAITADGIKIGRAFYYYKEVHHFFVVYKEKGIKKLYLQYRNPLRGRSAIPLDGQDAIAVREYLLNFIKEDLDREAEPISERMRRWLRM